MAQINLMVTVTSFGRSMPNTRMWSGIRNECLSLLVPKLCVDHWWFRYLCAPSWVILLVSLRLLPLVAICICLMLLYHTLRPGMAPRRPLLTPTVMVVDFHTVFWSPRSLPSAQASYTRLFSGDTRSRKTARSTTRGFRAPFSGAHLVDSINSLAPEALWHLNFF